MPDQIDLLDKDCKAASDLKQLMVEELSDKVELDEKNIDGLVRGIVSLLQSP